MTQEQPAPDEDRAPISWEALAAELAATRQADAGRDEHDPVTWDAVAAELAARVSDSPVEAPPEPAPVPEVTLDITPEQFAALAARALAPKAPEVVSVSHLHAPAVSVAEQLLIVRNHLVRTGTTSFRALTADCGHTNEVVARFLALLELYRQQRVVFEQLTPLGELHVRWTGGNVRPDEDDARADAEAVEDLDEEYS